VTIIANHQRLAVIAFAVAAHSSAPLLAQTGPVDDDSTGASDDDDRPPPPALPPIIGFGVDLGGMVLSEISALNDATSRVGLGRLPSVPLLLQPNIVLQLGRVVMPLRARISTTSSRESALGLETLGGLFGFGYLSLDRPELMIYPSLSFGLMRTRLTAGQSVGVPEPVRFEALTQSTGPVEVSRITVMAEAAFDAHYRIAGTSTEARGLFVGARLGFSAGLADSSWSLDHSGDRQIVANGGPRAPVGGPLAAVSLTFRP
jgi:hypothetical protein